MWPLTDTHRPISAKEKEREREKREEVRKISYVLAKLSLSYPVRRRKNVIDNANTPSLLCRQLKEREKKKEEKEIESKRMPSQDK